MKRSWIYLIIGLMTFALLGLAVIQYSYFKNTLTLKEAQFHYTVEMAMSQVGQEIQRYEAKQHVMRNKQGRQALDRLDSIQHVLSRGWSQSRGHYIKDTVVITDDGALKMSYTTYQEQGHAPFSSITSDIESEVMLMYNDEWIEEFITEMFDPGVLHPLDTRLDYADIDSIAHTVVFDPWVLKPIWTSLYSMGSMSRWCLTGTKA